MPSVMREDTHKAYVRWLRDYVGERQRNTVVREARFREGEIPGQIHYQLPYRDQKIGELDAPRPIAHAAHCQSRGGTP
jgi:hypothetical protein